MVDAYVDESPAGRSRVGIVVPAYGHTLAERNRLRRRLREIARREWLPRAPRDGAGPDLVIRARPAAYGVSYRSLRDSLLEALGRTWSEDPEPGPGGPSDLPCRAG